MRTLNNIKPLNDHQLECHFSGGTIKVADTKPYLDKEAFAPLRDQAVFNNSIMNGGYFIEWKDLEIDLSADTLWHIGKEVSDAVFIDNNLPGR